MWTELVTILTELSDVRLFGTTVVTRSRRGKEGVLCFSCCLLEDSFERICFFIGVVVVAVVVINIKGFSLIFS